MHSSTALLAALTAFLFVSVMSITFKLSPAPPQSFEPRYYFLEVVLLVYRLIMSAAVVLFMPDTLAQVGL